MTRIDLPPLTTKLWIGGEWRDAVDGGRMDVIDPATGQVATTVASGSASDIDLAVRAARAAFDGTGWRDLPVRERARVLGRIAAGMRDRADDLAAAESIDVGKPLSLARAVDVNNTADSFEYFASLASQLDGAAREVMAPAFAFTRTEPRGVVGAITPFNFPIILTSSKLAPALLAGNTVVHKPAPTTPLSALLFAEILRDAGVPDGVYNVVTGESPELGDALVRHDGVDMIAFTGSTTVGRLVARNAGENLKPVVAELGGNAANIVFADADLDVAIDAAINGFVFNTGQFCMAGPRLLVERPLHDTVVGILRDAVGKVPLGRPSDPGTVIGPLASADQLARVERMVADAVAAGGEIVAGGERIDLDGGYYYPPTIITGLDQDALAVREEVFGPVLTVQAFDTEEEAIALANGTDYGLAAGIQTRDYARAHRVAARLEAGIVWVNGWSLLDASMPFGGVRNSGWGRENGPESLASYTRTKSVVIGLGG